MQIDFLSPFNYIKNFFTFKEIIIFLGKNYFIFSSLKGDKVKEFKNISYQDPKALEKFQTLIETYKKYKIKFILDKDCSLKHEVIPLLSSFNQRKRAQQFITNKFNKTDLVSYSLYEVNMRNKIVINACVISSKLASPLKEMLEHVILKSYKYSAIYFFALELKTIINKFLESLNYENHQSDLQFLILVTKINGIKILIKHKSDILLDDTIPYPEKKSDLYIKGVIQQYIADKYIHYKDYTDKNELKKCVIIIAENSLIPALKDLNFEDTSIIISSNINLSKKPSILKAKKSLHDHILITLSGYFYKYPATNNVLAKLNSLNAFNNFFFKPLILLIILAGVNLTNIGYKTYTSKQETKELNKLYYFLSSQYRDYIKKYPSTININDIIDLYHLEKTLKLEPEVPFDYLNKIINNQYIANKKLKILNLDFQYNKNKSNLIKNNSIIILNIIQNKILSKKKEKKVNLIKKYINYLKFTLPEFNITYNLKNSVDLIDQTSYITEIILEKRHAR